ncbi:hypothetical protein KUTeg_002881 [Tegillarca granosa]|uniref:Uncharacterized protein n=1 Tax=Tegillarca granosa TaxID=220873 RepID=A0ABQ9FQK1_TEGGR|nr:hypothetical protein KUTeg_002881 [Tegillarca granosa]
MSDTQGPGVSPENKSTGVENYVEIREEVIDAFDYSDALEDRQYGIVENTRKEASDWFPFQITLKFKDIIKSRRVYG